MTEEGRSTRKTSVAWPHWMLRYVAANADEALSDLIASVTSDPPWGDVSVTEARAVESLVEAHQYQNVIPERVYEGALKLVRDSLEKSGALEVFRLHDRLAASPEEVTADDAAQGLGMAERFDHDGLRARFLALRATVEYKAGDVPDALRSSASALDLFRALAAGDAAYLNNFLLTGMNTATFSMVEGDLESARGIRDEIVAQVGPSAAAALKIPARPSFPADLMTVSEKGSNYLEGGDPVRAVEWLREAARLAEAGGQEATLCEILGDMAVAFRRLGNVPRAVQTYEEAIRLSRKHSDWVNLSRWCQNLGLLLLDRDDVELAAARMKEGVRAATLSGVAYQISTAAGNYAGLLARQQRFAEAMESLDQAAAAAGESPNLAALWQSQRVAVLVRWGRQLRDEGQTDSALDVFRKAVEAADLDDPEQKAAAAYAWTGIAELQERAGQLDAARASAGHAVALYRELGDDETAEKLEALAGESTRRPRTTGDVESADLDPAALEQQVREAVTRGDADAEATARMNFVAALRLGGDGRTAAEFENVLSLVRRLRDRRRELILSINFAPYFLELGEVKRAVTLAERGVKLAEGAGPGSMIYALANRAQVRMKGLNETGQALADFRLCSELLRAYIEQNPEDWVLPANVSLALAEGAQLAVKSGNTDLGLAIGAVIDPQLAGLLAQRRGGLKETPPAPDAAALRDLREPELDRALAAWHADGPAQTPPSDPLLARLAELAGILRWPQAAERFSRRPSPGGAEGSNPGAAGLLRLAEMVTDRTATLEAATATARELSVPDGDLDCIAMFALADQRRASKGVSFAAWRLIAAVAGPACRSRCYNLLGMFSVKGDPGAALEYYQLGAQALEGTELKQERARLLNEAAALLSGPLRRFEESLPVSELALRLAEETGAKDIAANATGNLALALLNLERAEEAAERFERLATLQQEIGDARGLEATKFNLKLAYSMSGKSERAQFDAGSDDPDVVFARAAELGFEARYQEAVAEFERGLSIVAEREDPYPYEGQVRMNFARTLYSAGDIERSVAEMKKAAFILEAARHTRDLHRALSWLASVRVEDEVEGFRYAQQALALSRNLGDDEEVAVDLAQLGQNRMAARRPDEAVELLEEAARLSGRDEIKSALAQALTGVGRTDEARRIYEELLGEVDDPMRKASLLIGLSEVLVKSGDDDGVLGRLEEARDVTAGSESREGAFTANHLGLTLLKRGRLEEAASALEDGIALARRLGLWRLELSLLSNFGNALKELGDLDGAEAALARAREECRDRGIRDSEAIALASLGNVSLTRDDPEGARARFQEAADLTHGVDAYTEAACVDSLGMIYSQLGKPERAVEYHRRAADLHEGLHAWDSFLLDLVNVGQTYLALDEKSAAAECLARARQAAREHDLSHWGLPLLAGQVAAAEGRWAEARGDFREAVKVVEGIRGSLPTPEAQRQWAAGKARIYRFAVQAALEAGDGEAAVEFIECSRARYLKAVLERRAHQPAGVDDETWLRYERAADSLAEARARRRSQVAAGRPPEEQELSEIEAEFKKAAAVVEAAAAASAESEAGVEFPLFADLVDRLPKGHAAVWVGAYGRSLGFVYAGRDGTGKAWSATALAPDGLAEGLDTLIFGNRSAIDEARREQTPLEDVPVADLGLRLAGYFLGQSDVFLDAIQRTYGLRVRDPESLFKRSLDHTCRWLGANLWPVIESGLPAGTRDVVLLPSAAINLLPLHAAVRPSGGRIDESYRIRYLPSLAMTREAHAASDSLRLGQVLNPSEDAGLAFSAVEAIGVSRGFADAPVSRLAGKKATAKKVLALLRKSDVFHFAGHAFYNSADPFHSGLMCAGRREADRVLTLAAVLQRIQSIPSRLVVLSACETGQVEPGDELDDFLGLPGAFLVAGAETVIASLWRVDDLAACLLIDKYFEVWGRGRVDAAEALAAAQKWLRSEVSVGYVTGKLKEWKERAGEGGEVLQAALWDWVARDDQESPAFPGESDWAAFYVTGLPSAA